MRLTNATEQAIAIMAIIATQEPSSLVSSECIYSKLSVSRSYIKKLLRKLVVSNIIEGISGNSGGFSLNKPLDQITLYDIVESIEGPLETFPDMGVLQRAFSEFDEIAQNGHNIVSSYFNIADRAWELELRKVTIQEVLMQVFNQEVVIPNRDWNQS